MKPILRDEAAYRLIELEQSINYIEDLDWNVYDEEGIIISVSFLEKRIITALKEGRQVYFAQSKEFPRMLWLAEVSRL